MRRMYLEPLLRLRVHPAAKDAAARENQRVGSVNVDHGDLDVAIERRRRNMLPHADERAAKRVRRFDLDQHKVIFVQSPPMEH